MNGTMKDFLRDERGVVITDWTVLTASMVLLGMAVVFGIFDRGVAPLVTSIGEAGASISLAEPIKIDVDMLIK